MPPDIPDDATEVAFRRPDPPVKFALIHGKTLVWMDVMDQRYPPVEEQWGKNYKLRKKLLEPVDVTRVWSDGRVERETRA